MPKTFREVVNEAKERISETSATDLIRRRDAGKPVPVVDVREPEDYRKGHIPGAVSIPRGVLEMRIDEVTTDEDRPIVLYCGGGSRSALSARTFGEMGYRSVESLSGGLRGWREKGMPVEATPDA